MGLYKIKENYVHRERAIYCDDRNNADKWQYEVYQFAHTIAKIIPKLPVLDIGCGSGYKLVNIFKCFDTTGIDVEQTYNFLIADYPDKHWEVKTDVPPTGKFGVIILADVIEHIDNPDTILRYIQNIDFQYLVISTPFRDSAGLSQNGPPNNLSHFREWTLKELSEYILDYFDVINHFIINKEQHTQCMVVKKYDNGTTN